MLCRSVCTAFAAGVAGHTWGSLRRLNTNDLCDAYWKEPVGTDSFQVLDGGLRMQHYGGAKVFAGPVVTVKCFEDNSFVKRLAGTAGSGRVLVVDGGASLRRALLGDMIAKAAQDNGWAGFVINGAVRDVDELRALGQLGVLALGSVPIKTDRKGLGTTDVTVTFGGVRFTSGQWVYCDETGVVVSARQLSLASSSSS
jgi:regulator of ribonuclease activity A